MPVWQGIEDTQPGTQPGVHKPGAPTAPTGTAGTLSITGNCTPPADTGGGGVVIDKWEMRATTGGVGTVSDPATALPVTLSNLAAATYTVAFRAHNSRGWGAWSGESANIVVASSTPNTPSAPTSVSAAAGHQAGSVTFSAPSSTGGSAVDGYQARFVPADGTANTKTGLLAVPGSFPATAAVSPLTAGTVGGMQVRAHNTNGYGPWANWPADQITVLDAATSVPGPPTSVTSTGGQVQASVTFSAPTDNGGSAILDYTATYTPDDGTTATDLAGIAVTSYPITATITGLAAGTGKVTVKARNANGFSGPAPTSPLSITITAATPSPAISGLTPSTGPLAGGTSVVIAGTAFTGATIVTFGGTNATSFTVDSDSKITAVAPARATSGTVDVRVTTPAGISAFKAKDHYTYAPGPVISSITPSTGPVAGSTAVVIAGSGFTGATAVTIGGASATGITVMSDTEIDCTSPAGPAGAQDVVVTTPVASGTLTGGYTYTAPTVPAVTAISPASGTNGGGTPVVITGTGFTGASEVDFGLSNPATFTVNSDTQITAVSPGQSGTADVHVRVVMGGAMSSTAPGNAWTYVTPTSPTRSLKAVSFANEPGGPSDLTTDMAPLYDIFVIQPTQLPAAGNLTAFRAANPGNSSIGQDAVAVIQYLNGSHETGYDRPGATQRFGTYSPPTSWYLYDSKGKKILNGANALMFPPSSASDGHGHAGWAAWRAHATAVIAADRAGYDGVMFDTMGKGGFMGGPIDPRTGLTYAVGTYCSDQAAAAAAMFAGWPGTPPHKYMVANGMNHAARYFDSGSAGPSSVLLAKPVYAAIAEQWLKPPSDDNVTWPGVSGNASGTYLQNVNMIADVTQTKGCWFYGIIRMESTTNRTALNMDYWQRIAIACALLGGNGYDSVAIQFEIHTGDTADYPFLRCCIGQPTDSAHTGGTVYYRNFDGPGLVFLNTDNTTAHATPIQLPGGSAATWVDVGPVVTNSPGGQGWNGGDTPTVPAHSALILQRTG